MRGLGFALGSIIGMAITARERKAADLNEMGIILANQYRYEEALSYLLEAKELMPENVYIQNNIGICRQALNEKRRLLRERQKASREHNYTQSTSHNIKSDSIKYYSPLQDIPEDLLIIFFKEKHLNFNSKSDLINHAYKYWSNKDTENFIKEFEFYENKLLKIKHQLEQQRLEEEQKRLEEEQKRLEVMQKGLDEREKLYHMIQYSKTDFQNFIIDNMDVLCRIYSIPKLGKTYVVNHICDNYSALEVWNALERYK